MEATVVRTGTEGKTWGGGNEPLKASYGKLMMWFFITSDALTFSGFLAAYGFSRFKFIDSWPIADEVFNHFPFLHGVDAPMYYVALMTFILIFSSVTMVLAVDAGHQLKKGKVTFYMFLTIIGGIIFLGSQAWEWSHFIHGSGGYIITENNSKYFLAEEIPQGETAASFADFTLIANKGEENETTITGQKAVDLYNNKLQYIQGANMTINEYGPPQYANFFFFITGFHGFHVFSGVVINIIVFIGVVKGIYHKRGHYEMVEKTGLYWHFVDLVWVFVFTFFYLI